MSHVQVEWRGLSRIQIEGGLMGEGHVQAGRKTESLVQVEGGGGLMSKSHAKLGGELRVTFKLKVVLMDESHVQAGRRAESHVQVDG